VLRLVGGDQLDVLADHLLAGDLDPDAKRGRQPRPGRLRRRCRAAANADRSAGHHRGRRADRVDHQQDAHGPVHFCCCFSRAGSLSLQAAEAALKAGSFCSWSRVT
jgi:hypothetical protein